MYATYKELLNFPCFKSAKVIAGENGLYRTIRWAQILEMEDIKEWTTPGSLVYTTGVGQENWKLGIEYIAQQAIDAEASGLCVCVGPYIKSLPESLLELCNENNFPLISVPKEVKTHEVFYQLSKIIFSNQNHSEEISSVFSDVYMNQITPETIFQLEQIKFDGETYRCILFRTDLGIIKNTSPTNSDIKSLKWDDLANLIKNCFAKNNILSIYNHVAGSLSFIITGKNETINDRNIYENIYKVINSKHIDINVIMTVSESVDNVHKLGQAMRHAIFTYEIACHQDYTNSAVFYLDLGIYRLINSDNIEIEKKNFINDYLGPILDKPSLIITLKSYISNNMNATDAASNLYIHVNTMKYRIKQIENLLHCNLKDLNTILNLKTALAIYDLEK